METVKFVNEEFTLPSNRKQSEINRGVIKEIFQDYQTIEFSWTTIQNKTRHELQLFCEGIDGQYIFTEFSELPDIGAVVPRQIATYIGPLRMLGMVDGYTAVPVKGIVTVRIENSLALNYVEYLAEMAKICDIPHLPSFVQIDVAGENQQTTDLRGYVEKLKTIVEQHRNTIDIF